jgi:hypothetical protein
MCGGACMSSSFEAEFSAPLFLCTLTLVRGVLVHSCPRAITLVLVHPPCAQEPYCLCTLVHVHPYSCAQEPYCLCTLVRVHPCSCASHMACSRHPSVWPQLFLQAQMISATVNALTFLHPACIIGAYACIVSSECFCVCSFSALLGINIG